MSVLILKNLDLTQQKIICHNDVIIPYCNFKPKKRSN